MPSLTCSASPPCTYLVQAATGNDRYELRRSAEIGHNLLWDAADPLQIYGTRSASAGLIDRERLMLQLVCQVAQLLQRTATEPGTADAGQPREPARPQGPYPPSVRPTTPQHPSSTGPLKGTLLMPKTVRTTNVYLLFAHEPYSPGPGTEEINTTTVLAADSLLHPQVLQPDGTRTPAAPAHRRPPHPVRIHPHRRPPPGSPPTRPASRKAAAASASSSPSPLSRSPTAAYSYDGNLMDFPSARTGLDTAHASDLPREQQRAIRAFCKALQHSTTRHPHPEEPPMPATPPITVSITRYTVSVLPEDDINHKHFALHVELRRRGWVVHNGHEYFAPGGSAEHSEGTAHHFADHEDALALARRLAPGLVVNGHTSSDAYHRTHPTPGA